MRCMTMRWIILLALLLLPIDGAAAQSGRAADFRSMMPPGWTLLPPDNNWHGYRFASPAGDAWLSLYSRAAERESVDAHMQWVRTIPGERITYERKGRGWIVVSGYKDDRIFYRKAMLACGDRRWHHLAFEYPASRKREFDRFVTRASGALKAYRQAGCRTDS
jgi:hypothetical protein